MALAASFAAVWVTASGSVADKVKRLEDACASACRDPATIDRLALTGLELPAGLESEASFVDTIGRYAEAGVTDVVVHWPRRSEPYAGDVETFERVVGAVL
jgi:hypothetical protein